MKFKLFISLFFLSTFCFGQNQIEIIKIKNKSNAITLSAKNRSNYIYDMTVDIVMIGLNCNKDLPLSFRIKPGETQEIAVLTPNPEIEERYYKVHYRAEPEDRSNTLLTYDVIEPNITIYTKNNHSESTYLSRYLKKNSIPFIEINVDYNEETMKRYTEMLKRRSIEPNQVKFPVVIYRGEISYSIKDMEDFCIKKLRPVKKY